MKQLGNLALVCAQRPEVLMQVYDGMVSVHVGVGPNRSTLRAPWHDDKKVSGIIYELNFGRYAEKRSA